MNYDVHILLACLVGITFSALLLTAAGRTETKKQQVVYRYERRNEQGRWRRAA